MHGLGRLLRNMLVVLLLHLHLNLSQFDLVEVLSVVRMLLRQLDHRYILILEFTLRPQRIVV
jgi:hypothetical protein